MAILKETNMWFILIVVFAYMIPLVFSVNAEQVCSTDFQRNCWDQKQVLCVLLQAEPETCSTFFREPQSSLDVDFAFCISLEAPALHGKNTQLCNCMILPK